MFKYLYSCDVDAIDYYTHNSNLVAIDTAGSVKFCYCECMGEVDPGVDQGSEDTQCLHVRLLGAVFQQDGNRPYSICLGFNQLFEFPIAAHRNWINIIDDQKKKIRRQITQIRIQ